jgi:hypothetical protein
MSGILSPANFGQKGEQQPAMLRACGH